MRIDKLLAESHSLRLVINALENLQSIERKIDDHHTHVHGYIVPAYVRRRQRRLRIVRRKTA